MTLKEQFSADLPIFLNLDEFAERHTINGKTVDALIDNNALDEKLASARGARSISSSAHTDGLFRAEMLVYVRTADLGGLPRTGSMIRLDGREYRVTEAVEEMGVCSLCLEAIRI